MQIEGRYNTATVYTERIDESAMAYKSIADIVENITPTVEIEARITPIYSIPNITEHGFRRPFFAIAS